MPRICTSGGVLRKPNDATSDDHAFEAFSGNVGTAADARVDVTDTQTTIEGTASYTGMATGKFVTRTYTAGVLQSSNVGPFSADVSLTATFDANGDGTADATDNMIKGSVEDFRDMNGDSLGGWVVTLADKPLVTAGNTNVNLGAETQTMAGMWTSTYHYGTAPAHPGAVIGEFDAHAAGEVASIYGAYGAMKDDDE